MLQDLTHSLQLRPTRSHVLWELGSCISSAVGADGFRLYLADPGSPDVLSLYLGHETLAEDGEPQLHKVKSGLTVPTYVARTREPVRLSRGDIDARFPEGITNKDTAHILCQAVVQPDGQLVAVLELWRREHGAPFHEEDEEIAYSYLVWGAIAIHYAHLFLNMNKQRRLNDFLLAVVKSIFQVTHFIIYRKDYLSNFGSYLTAKLFIIVKSIYKSSRICWKMAIKYSISWKHLTDTLQNYGYRVNWTSKIFE